MASEAKSEGRCETFENTPASNDRGLDGLPCLQHLSEDELRSAEKRLKRKLDLRLTAMIVLIYILNYLDRVSAQPLYDFCAMETDLRRTTLLHPKLPASKMISISRRRSFQQQSLCSLYVPCTAC